MIFFTPVSIDNFTLVMWNSFAKNLLCALHQNPDGLKIAKKDVINIDLSHYSNSICNVTTGLISSTGVSIERLALVEAGLTKNRSLWLLHQNLDCPKLPKSAIDIDAINNDAIDNDAINNDPINFDANNNDANNICY